MTKTIFSTYLIVASALLISCENNDAKSTNLKAGVWEANLFHPESIAYDGANFYASEFGANLTPHIKDGAGSIVKINNEGKVLITNISKTNLNKPKGITIVEKTLLVCDIDSLKAINIETGMLEYAINFGDLGLDLAAAGGTGLNDIAMGKNNNIAYVSITNNGKIYQVNLDTKTKKEIAAVANANGLAYDKEKNLLYAVGYTNKASLSKIDLNTNVTSLLENGYIGKGGLDGIAIVGRNLIISDWGTGADGGNEVGEIIAYDLDTKTNSSINIKASTNKEKLNGPADFIEVDGFIIVPALGGGKAYVIKL